MDPVDGESSAKVRLIIQHVLSVAGEPGNKHAVAVFGAVPIYLANRLQSFAQLDIRGYALSIDTSAIRHIRKEHGDPDRERRRGQINVGDDDFRDIPAITAYPDMVIIGEKSKLGRDQIVFLRQLTSHWVVIWSEIRTGRRHVSIVSMRKHPPAMNADRILATLDPNARSNRGTERQIIDMSSRFNEAPANADGAGGDEESTTP